MHLSGFEPHWGYAEMVVSFDEQSNPVRTSHLDAEGRSVETEVLVTLVLSGSRAEKMGIRAGDVLLDYNGRPVLDFFRFIRERDAEPADGPASKLRIRRGEAILTFSIPPGKLGMGLQGRGIGRRSPGDVEVGARSAVPATP